MTLEVAKSPFLFALILTVALADCRTADDTSTGKDDPATQTSDDGADGSSAASTLAATQPATGVLMHHNHPGRDGLFADPVLTRAKAAGLHRALNFSATYQGNVYAQPLYVDNGPGGSPVVIVGTEANDIFAFDAKTGATVWHQSLGTPMSLANLPCGNIDPLGVTGTGVIDSPSRTYFVGAMTAADDGSPRQKIFALSIDNGSVVDGWPVDVGSLSAQGVSFDSSTQNQRGALALLGGTLYVPYGGHWGDCGTYHGWIVGVPIATPASAMAWATRAQGGGVWAPSGIAADAKSLFVATGNTFSTDTWQDGEALIHLQPGPTFSAATSDYFAPLNWNGLDADDVDLGGSGAVLAATNSASNQNLLAAFGKDGFAYLVDPSNLGGVGHQLSSVQVNSGSIITAPATFATNTDRFFVVHAYSGAGVGCPSGQGGTLLGLKILSPPSWQVAWCQSVAGRGSAVVSSSSTDASAGASETVVWVIGSESDNRLHGFNAETGAVIFAGGGANDGMNKVRRFQSPIVAGGRIYVAGDNQLYAFDY